MGQEMSVCLSVDDDMLRLVVVLEEEEGGVRVVVDDTPTLTMLDREDELTKATDGRKRVDLPAVAILEKCGRVAEAAVKRREKAVSFMELACCWLLCTTVAFCHDYVGIFPARKDQLARTPTSTPFPPAGFD